MKYIFITAFLFFNFASCSKYDYSNYHLKSTIYNTISILKAEVISSGVDDKDKIELLHSRLSKVSEEHATPIFIQCVSDSIQDLEDVCVFILDEDEGLVQVWPYKE